MKRMIDKKNHNEQIFELYDKEFRITGDQLKSCQKVSEKTGIKTETIRSRVKRRRHNTKILHREPVNKKLLLLPYECKKTKTVDQTIHLFSIDINLLVYLLNRTRIYYVDIEDNEEKIEEYILNFKDLTSLSCASQELFQMFNYDIHDLWGNISNKRGYRKYKFIAYNKLVGLTMRFLKPFHFYLNENGLSICQKCNKQTEFRGNITKKSKKDKNFTVTVPVSIFRLRSDCSTYRCIYCCNTLQSDIKICGFNLLYVFDACTFDRNEKKRSHKWKVLAFDLKNSKSEFNYCMRCGLLNCFNNISTCCGYEICVCKPCNDCDKMPLLCKCFKCTECGLCNCKTCKKKQRNICKCIFCEYCDLLDTMCECEEEYMF